MSYQPQAYHHASVIPQDVWAALFLNEASANVILSFAQKALTFPHDKAQLWIALYDGADVKFVLSCTTGPLGNYPIFLVACKPLAEDLSGALLPLVQCLLNEVPPQRIFSVFALANVAEVFATTFVAQAPAECRIQAINEPFYDATLTFCSNETLKRPSESVSSMPGSDDDIISLRQADMSHLDALGVMCREFSETSPPFVLGDVEAKLEAENMIKNKQVWVHIVQKAGGEPELACLIATTRESENVTAVTKVYTPEQWRGRGCAARLLHRVCHDLLLKKKRVVLYVGNSVELASARKVYHKVGFQGLNGPPSQQTEGVERWLEIGFEGTTLGHW